MRAGALGMGALVLGALAAAGIGPESPLNDEPFFRWSVTHHAETGTIAVQRSVFPRFLGLLVAVLPLNRGGLPLSALRALVMGCAVVAALGMNRLAGRQWRALEPALALVAFAPFYFLSHVFMTDVPYIGASVLALIVVSRAQDTGRIGTWILGVVLAAAAMSIRQYGLMVLVAAALVHALRRRTGAACAQGVGLVALALAVHGALEAASGATAVGNIGATVRHVTLAQVAAQLPDVPVRLFVAATLLALASAPVVLPRLVACAAAGRWRVERGTVATALLVVAWGWGTAKVLGRWTFPYLPNLLQPASLGPPLLAGALPVLDRTPWQWALTALLAGIVWAALVELRRWGQALRGAAPAAAWASAARLAVSVAGSGLVVGGLFLSAPRSLWPGAMWPQLPEVATVAMAAWLVAVVALWLADAALEPRAVAADGSFPRPDATDALLLVYGALTLGLMLVLPWFMDRYVVCLAPVALALAYRWRLDGEPAWARRVLIGLALAASIGGTASYFAWSEARWALAMRLVREQGLAAADVDGGFEWSITAALDRASPSRCGARPDAASVPWWVGMTELPPPCFAIAWTPLPGWETVEESRYRRPFGFGEGRLFVLRWAGAAP